MLRTRATFSWPTLYVYYDTGHFTTYGNIWGIVTAGSGLARIYVSLTLTYIPQPEIYNATKTFPNLVLIHFSVITIYNAYLQIGLSNYATTHFSFRFILCAELAPHTITLHGQSEQSLRSEIGLAYLKLTSGWQPNATPLSVALHKVSSG